MTGVDLLLWLLDLAYLLLIFLGIREWCRMTPEERHQAWKDARQDPY